MWSPWRTVSSPVLTMAVMSAGGTDLHHPPQQAGRPHPAGQGGDHRARTVAATGSARARTGGGHRGRLPGPVPAGTGRGPTGDVQGSAACRRSDLLPPTGTGCPSDSTPRRCSGRPTGVGAFCAGALAGLAALPAVEVSAFAVSWRRRHELAALVPVRGLDPAAGHAGPAAPRGVGALRRCHRSSGSSAATTWCTGPTSWSRRPGPAARVVTVHDLTVVLYPELCDPPTLRVPRPHPPGGRPRGRGSTRRPGSWPTRWWRSSRFDPERVRAVHHGIPLAPTDVERRARPSRPAARRVRPLRAGRRDHRAAQGLPPAGLGLRRRWPPPIPTWPWWWWAATAGGPSASPPRWRRRRGGHGSCAPGYLDDEALAAALRHAAVLAYPSRYEGFGFPPLQAMAAGVPVVATAAGAVPEVVGDGALLVDPGRRRRAGRGPRPGARRRGRHRRAGGPGPPTERRVHLGGLCRGSGPAVPATPARTPGPAPPVPGQSAPGRTGGGADEPTCAC